MRRDAERNRDRLIAAARDIMRSEGGDAPMELIAERAGLTRGTLYRNFPHRQAMYEAVLEHDLTTISQRLATEQDQDPLGFIRCMAELMMVYDKFLVALSDMDDYDVGGNQQRMASAVAVPLAIAKARGVLRSSLGPDDILMACRMLASHLRLDTERDPSKALDQRLRLLLAGLGEPAA